eukprot:TRINITY_DN8654_c0_g1_i1.p1 TRINITY_DN8654_c0_g1~~TRINITY_DN8654_c0_g1_i1.p1  ORF type:complete len:278 (+),score=101.35 TRINITY_DN8654_c0_g1_i1:57-890(+)
MGDVQPAGSYSKLITLRYQPPAPPPQEPVADPTPDDDYQQYLKECEDKHEKTVAAARGQQRSAAEDESIVNKVGGYASSAVTHLGDGVSQLHVNAENAGRAKMMEMNQKSFQKEFAVTAATSKYISCFDCFALHSGQKVEGTLYICDKAVCFASKQGIRDEIRLTDIASIVPSVALPCSRAMDGREDSPPYVVPLPAPAVQGNCLQLFVSNGQLVQFLNFNTASAGRYAQQLTGSVKKPAYDRCYNFLDHAWRAALIAGDSPSPAAALPDGMAQVSC